MKKNDVERVVDLAALPPLSSADADRVRSLLNASEDEIDTTDIAPLTENFWRAAVPNPFYRPIKTSTTIRIDADVLAWFRAKGKGYQSRINAALRQVMLASEKQD